MELVFRAIPCARSRRWNLPATVRMNLYSSCNLIARSDMASIVDSLVAPLSVINALVVALCMKKKKEVVTTLEMLERLWGEYQVYSADELNPLSDLGEE